MEAKKLSRRAKEVLIKIVAQSLPGYAMNVFLLPMEITKEIESLLTKFWWSTSESYNSRINWMAWDRITRHKRSGGLGFINFRKFNLTMLG